MTAWFCSSFVATDHDDDDDAFPFPLAATEKETQATPREREGSGSARAACSRAPGWRGVRGKGGKERKKRKKAPREEAAWLEEEKCGWLRNSLAELPGRLAPDEPDAGCRRAIRLFGQTENIDSGQSERLGQTHRQPRWKLRRRAPERFRKGPKCLQRCQSKWPGQTRRAVAVAAMRSSEMADFCGQCS